MGKICGKKSKRQTKSKARPGRDITMFIEMIKLF